MNKEKFTFELIDKYTPDIVIKNLLKEIERDTKGYVIGNTDMMAQLIFILNEVEDLRQFWEQCSKCQKWWIYSRI